MGANTAGILAVELLAACQGIDFRKPLMTSPLLDEAKALLRRHVPFYDKDRYFSPDIEAASRLIVSSAYNRFMPEGLLPSL
jgi:histidine ammonia-lyase